MTNKFGTINYSLWAYWGTPPTYEIRNTQYKKIYKTNPIQRRNTIYAIRNTRLFMQNKPNFKFTAYMNKSPNGPRITGQESRFIQNEPNLNNRAKRICKTNPISIAPPHLLYFLALGAANPIKLPMPLPPTYQRY
jgi:hypothetical protein